MRTMKKRFLAFLCAGVGAIALGAAVSNVSAAAEELKTTITIKMYDGGSIRTSGPVGIRFHTTYSITPADETVDVDAFLANYTFGTLIIPSDMVTGELTHETYGVVDVEKKVWASDSTQTDKIMYSVLSGIPDEAENYTRNITARSYYTVDGITTYSDTVVERNIAQVAAGFLNDNKTDDVCSKYVNAIAKDVNISEVRKDMVIGGVETLTATTSPEGYKVVWSSDNSSVVSVNKNGELTAKAKGTANITATFGEHSDTITVTVADCVARDGSEIVYTVENATVGGYAQTEETVGDRTGVYKYSTTQTEWTQKLNIKEAGHLNTDDGNARKESYAQFKRKGYNFVAFDIYLTSGAKATISAMGETVNSYPGDTLIAGNSITEKNSNVSVYTKEGFEVSYVLAGAWYTVVVDYSGISMEDYYSTDRNKNYCRIDIGGIYGTIYLDNVRYYGSDVWKDSITKEYIQKDGSEFVIGSGWDATAASYSLWKGDGTEGSENIFGRTNVWKYTSTSTSWNDKITIRECNHTGTAINASPTAAQTNMKAKGYNYVTFDMCMISGMITVNAPHADSTNTTGQFYDLIEVNKEMTKNNSNVQYYELDENGNFLIDAEGNYLTVTSLKANTWYRVVVQYAIIDEYSGLYAGIDIGARWKPTVYFDNVRYYNANPMV